MRGFIKKEPVLCAAVFLAAVSSVFVRPSVSAIFSSIDWRVLCLLFSLMILIQAYRSIKVLDFLACKVLGICSSVRAVYLALVFLVFFASMAVTNDVALLTFVPITLIICRRAGLRAAPLVVLETVAANLGSSMTPMGNPQNLFLYSYYTMSAASFFGVVLKLGIISIPLLAIAAVWETSGTRKTHNMLESSASARFKVEADFTAGVPPLKTTLYSALLILVLLSVFRVVDYRIAAVVTAAVLLVCNYRLFAAVDYSLLCTFAGFFIFTANIASVPAVSAFLRNIQGTPLTAYITGICVSQCISNVPAALLLSGFTNYAEDLLLAVNVGGLGTLIASLASVISFKLYTTQCNETGGSSYMKIFSIYNVLFLLVIGVIARLV